MKINKIAQISILLAICLSISILVIALIPLRQALVFTPVHSSAKAAFILVNNESTFQIKYTHSIHLSDVVESYKIRADQQIQQYGLEYEDTSIGMPANAEKGERFEQLNGKYYIKNMKRIFPSFYLRIGQVRANHRVIFNHKEYPLAHTIKPGTVVIVEIRKLNIVQIWKGVNILEYL